MPPQETKNEPFVPATGVLPGSLSPVTSALQGDVKDISVGGAGGGGRGVPSHTFHFKAGLWDEGSVIFSWKRPSQAPAFSVRRGNGLRVRFARGTRGSVNTGGQSGVSAPPGRRDCGREADACPQVTESSSQDSSAGPLGVGEALDLRTFRSQWLITERTVPTDGLRV